MRAIWMDELGGPEVLVPLELPDPVAGAGQVLIEVAFVNITFVETQTRSGNGPFALELPTVPGNGVGGVIVAVGDGVDPALAGSRVVSSTGGSGAYAERVVVDAALPFHVPGSLSLDDAVALLADGRTAMMLIDAAELRSGARVLVLAAAGGVGSLLVQLAPDAGATVVAAAGGDAKVETVLQLGAKHGVDYGHPRWTDAVRDALGAVDVVFDGVGGQIARDAFELIPPGGRMISFGLASGTWADVSEDEAAARGVELVSPQPTPADLRECTERALAAGAADTLRPLIGQRFPLERAADAHRAIERRATTGKTLLEVGPRR